MDNGWWWWSVVSGGGGNFILSTSCVGYTPVVGCVAPMCRDGYGFFYSIEPAQSVKSRWYRCGWDVVLQRWIKLKVLTPDQLMPLPLTVSCFSKIQIGFTFLVPAHPGSPWQGPLNGCVGVCVCVCSWHTAGFLRSGHCFICPLWSALLGLWGVMCLDSIFDLNAICTVCLFISYAFPLVLFSSLFPYLSPPLLIFSFENRPLCFQAGCRKRQLNLALVFCICFVCCSAFFSDWWMCAFGLTRRIPRTVYWYFWAYQFFTFSVFHFLVVASVQ